MDIELTTNNLKKLCRICLNEGQCNIWLNKVHLNIPTNEYGSKEDGFNDVPLMNMIEIFNNWNLTIMDLKDDFTLICYNCLSGFIKSYIFYKKLERANEQIKRLYQSAQEIECDDMKDNISNENSIDVDANEVHHNWYDMIDDDLESNCISVEEENYLDEMYKERNEKDGDSLQQLNTEMSSEEMTEISPTCTIDNSDHINNSFLQTIPQSINKIPVKKGQDASLVVGQFISSVHMNETQNDNATANVIAKYANDTYIRTLDFTPVEVKGSTINHPAKVQLALTSNILDNYIDEESTHSVFACKYCPKAYSAPDYLISHVRKCHVCQYCMQAFNKDSDLFEHLKTVHRNHICKICSKELSSHSNLRAHIRRIHGLQLPAKVALIDFRIDDKNTSPELDELNDEKSDQDVNETNFEILHEYHNSTEEPD